MQWAHMAAEAGFIHGPLPIFFSEATHAAAWHSHPPTPALVPLPFPLLFPFPLDPEDLHEYEDSLIPECDVFEYCGDQDESVPLD